MLSARALSPRDILRLHALTAPDRLIGHPLTVLKELVTVVRYAGVVQEDSFACVIRDDETVAYLGAY